MPLALRPRRPEQQREQGGEWECDDQAGAQEDERERRGMSAGGSAPGDVDGDARDEEQCPDEHGQLHPNGAPPLPPLDLTGQQLSFTMWEPHIVRRRSPPLCVTLRNPA